MTTCGGTGVSVSEPAVIERLRVGPKEGIASLDKEVSSDTVALLPSSAISGAICSCRTPKPGHPPTSGTSIAAEKASVGAAASAGWETFMTELPRTYVNGGMKTNGKYSTLTFQLEIVLVASS